jgi:hypothetical protein
MLASASFDPRLMWDAALRHGQADLVAPPPTVQVPQPS